MNTTRHQLLATMALASALGMSTPAWSQSERGSQAASAGALSVLASPVLSLEGKPLDASAALGVGGVFIVGGLAVASAEVTVVTLKAVVTGSEYLVRVSAKAAQGLSLATGQSVRIVAESTGYAILAAGQLLAFVPNAIGQALLYQGPLK